MTNLGMRNNYEKRQVVVRELRHDPGRSNRAIARKLELSEGLVRDVRKELEEKGELQQGKPAVGGRPANNPRMNSKRHTSDHDESIDLAWDDSDPETSQDDLDRWR